MFYKTTIMEIFWGKQKFDRKKRVLLSALSVSVLVELVSVLIFATSKGYEQAFSCFHLL